MKGSRLTTLDPSVRFADTSPSMTMGRQIELTAARPHTLAGSLGILTPSAHGNLPSMTRRAPGLLCRAQGLERRVRSDDGGVDRLAISGKVGGAGIARRYIRPRDASHSGLGQPRSLLSSTSHSPLSTEPFPFARFGTER